MPDEKDALCADCDRQTLQLKQLEHDNNALRSSLCNANRQVGQQKADIISLEEILHLRAQNGTEFQRANGALCSERYRLEQEKNALRDERDAAVGRLQQLQIAHSAPVAPRSTECCVCTNAPPSVLYLPCKHLAVCSACDNVLERQGSSCPICRGAIQQRYPGVILP
jgi:hypothetical protein